MSNDFSFLNRKDLADFNTEKRNIARSVVGVDMGPLKEVPPGDQNDHPLVARISNLFLRHQGEEALARWFECCCVTVRRDDGMSWSAEAVRLKLLQSYPHLKIVGLPVQRGTEKRQQIRELVGDKRFMRRAAQNKLTPRHATHPFIKYSLAVVLALLTATTLLLTIFGSSTPLQPLQTSLLQRPWFLGLAAAGVAFLALLTLLIEPKVKAALSRSQGDLDEELWNSLNELERQGSNFPKPYHDFIESLAEDLGQADAARVIIVDDFERLDPTTRAVIGRYFESHCERGSANEMWIIFQRDDGQAFSATALNKFNQFGYSKTRFYRQLPLTEEQKLDLATFLQHPETRQFSTVKAVCGNSTEARKHIKETLGHFREDHPAARQRIDVLDFLNLLAATAGAGDIVFTVQRLKQLLAQTTKVRAQVLSELLRGAALGLGEIQSSFDAAANTFPLFVTIDGSGLTLKLQSTVEVAEALAETRDLPSPGLTHVFWSLFWYDYALNQPYQAFLLRKLVYHLKKAELSDCPDKLKTALRKQLFEVALYTSEGLRQTCIFRETSLEDTLARAVFFNGDAPGDEKTKEIDRLLTMCWEAYSILGRDPILEQIIRVFQGESAQEPEVSIAADATAPGALFFAALGLPAEGRETLIGEFSPRTAAERQYLASAQDYAYSRASWLAVSLSPLLTQPEASRVLLQRSTVASSESLSEVLDRCCARVMKSTSSSSSHLPAIDVASASLCLWSLSLLLCEPAEEPLRQHWDKLAGMADSALLVAQYLLEQKNLGAGLDAVENALARELSAMAIASLLMAHRRGGIEGGIDTERLEKQIQFGEGIFGSTRARGEQANKLDSPLLLEKIDALLAVCAFVWKQLGLEEMCTCAHIRRYQFNSTCDRLSFGKLKDGKELMDVSGVNDSKGGYTNILADCVAANCRRESGELVAYYVRDAASIAREIGCSAQLKREMALFAVYCSYPYSIDLSPFLWDLLAEDGEGGGYLYDLLGRMTDFDLDTCELVFLDTTLFVKDEGIVGTVEQIFSQFISAMPKGQVREGMSARLDYFRLRWLVQRGKPLPPAGEVLEQWSNRKDSRTYLDVLRLLVDRGDFSDRIQAEALLLLRTDGAPDNGNLLLALELSRTPISKDPEGERALVTCLENEIERWESREDAETNLEVLRFLSDHDSPHATVARLAKWDKIKIERDHRLKLRDYVNHNKYMFLVIAYCDWAWFWGLGRDAHGDEWSRLFGADQDTRERILKEWRSNGHQVPEPIVSSDRQTCISSRFLSLGTFLFLPPSDNDKSWDEDRKRFNEKSRKFWPTLLNMILGLEALPPDIRELLREHSQALLQYDGLLNKGNGRSMNAPPASRPGFEKDSHRSAATALGTA